MSDETITRPALGQTASLGSLYKAGTDQIIPQNLFEQTLTADYIVTTSDASKPNWSMTKSDSLREKFDTLELSGDLGLSYLAGMVTAAGSGAWLSRSKSSARAGESSAVYTVRTLKETLDMTQKGLDSLVDDDAVDPEVMEDVTHVVSGVQWGARVIITARSKASTVAKQDTLERLLSSFTVPTADDLQDVSELAKSYDFTISSDIKCGTKPYDYMAVREFIGNVASSIKKSNGGKGFRLSYDLLPIEDAAKALGKDDDIEWSSVEEIDEAMASKVIQSFEDLSHAKQEMADYVSDVKAHSNCVPKEHVTAAQKQAKGLSGIETALKSKLFQALVNMRTQDAEDVELQRLIDEFQKKLSRKVAPLSIIGNYVQKMAFAGSIQACSSQNIHYVADDVAATEKLIKDAASDDVYVFYFDVAGIADPAWSHNRDKVLDLIRGHNTVILVDCDMGASHRKLDNPHIEQLQGGTVIVPDLVAEIQSLAGKSLLRPGKPESLEKPTEKDPSSDKQRPVKLPCPGPNCDSSAQCEWICPVCKDAVLAGFTGDSPNDYLYCSCGKYLYTGAVFKCQGVKHGEEYAAYSDTSKLRIAVTKLAPFEEFNILILGETGVGKSTFINAFINYLVFDSLDEAQKTPGLRWAVPSSFSYDEVDANGYRTRSVTVTVGEESDLEHHSQGGVSATQKTVTYSLNMNGKIIRLIDTPGIGDTRGLAQDYENVKDILATLESINRLSTVLFLMKPNSARLTTTFDFCITELLTHLHKDTSKNIVFGFTNARSTNYQLGDTRGPLEALLKKRNTGIDTLDHKNIFFFDSESFRFLAAYKQEGTEMPGKGVYVESWEKSAEEARRLVNTSLTAPTHEVKKTLMLNRTRNMILNMTKPMIEQTNAMALTRGLIDKDIKEINQCIADGKEWEGKQLMEEAIPVRYDYAFPKTVCTDKACITTEWDKANSRRIAVYNTVCHDRCYVQVPDEQVGLPQLSECVAFGCKGDKCSNKDCGHDWRIHLHITHEFKIEVKQIPNSTAVQELLKANNKKAAAETRRKEAEKKLAELDAEGLEIKKALATFGVYLDRSAIVAFNDSTIGYLQQLIKKAEVEGNQEDIDRYKNEIVAYETQRDQITEAIANKTTEAPTEETITAVIELLRSLPNTGKILAANLGLDIGTDGNIEPPNHRSRPVKLKPSGTTWYKWMSAKAANLGRRLGF